VRRQRALAGTDQEVRLRGQTRCQVIRTTRTELTLDLVVLIGKPRDKQRAWRDVRRFGRSFWFGWRTGR
jgi:hypothetical protein